VIDRFHQRAEIEYDVIPLNNCTREDRITLLFYSAVSSDVFTVNACLSAAISFVCVFLCCFTTGGHQAGYTRLSLGHTQFGVIATNPGHLQDATFAREKIQREIYKAINEL